MTGVAHVASNVLAHAGALDTTIVAITNTNPRVAMLPAILNNPNRKVDLTRTPLCAVSTYPQDSVLR